MKTLPCKATLPCLRNVGEAIKAHKTATVETMEVSMMEAGYSLKNVRAAIKFLTKKGLIRAEGEQLTYAL